RQFARLFQHVLDSRPVHGEQHRVRFPRGLARRAGPRLARGVPCERLELPLAAGVAEHHLMARARQDRSELAAHQPGTENADAHVSPSIVAQRLIIRCALSEYRAPCTVIRAAALSISRRSPSVSSTVAAVTFSC